MSNIRYKSRTGVFSMLFFGLMKTIFAIDYTEGYYAITTPFGTNITLTDGDKIKVQKGPMPTKVTDKNLMKIVKNGDVFSIKFVSNNKFLCKGEGTSSKLCDKMNELKSKYFIENQGDGKIRFRQKELCLARSGPNQEYVAFVKCGVYPHRQVWNLKPATIKEEEVKKPKTPKKKDAEKSASKDLSTSASKSKELSVSASKSKDLSLSGSKSKDLSVEGSKTQDLSVSGSKDLSSSSSKSKDISTSDKKSKDISNVVAESIGAMKKAVGGDTKSIITSAGEIEGSDEIGIIKVNGEPIATGESSIQTQSCTPCTQPCAMPPCCPQTPSVCSGGVVPTEQFIVSDNGVEKVGNGIDAIKKAMKDIGSSGGNDISIPAEGKTTRIVRIV